MGNEALNWDGLSKNESSTDVRGINGWGGDTTYERGGDACRKFELNP